MKTKIIPFDLEMAKKIQAGEIEGKMVEVTTKKFTYNSHGCIAIDQKVDKFIELPEEASNIIDSKSLYDKWTDIQDSLIELFREKAVKNNVKFSDADLVHYAAELFTWFRETHLIFKFRLDKLEELKQYAEEHIMEPSWCSEAKQNIKKIFGLESPKHEFKPFDKVLVRNKDDEGWQSRLYDMYLIGLGHAVQDNFCYVQCIPYAGNENLVGTTDKPE